MPNGNLGSNQPKKQMVKTKTKINLGVAISIGIITLTLVFTGSMFLFASSWSVAKYVVQSKAKAGRSRPAPTSIIPVSKKAPPPLGSCESLRRVVYVPGDAPTVEDAIATYGTTTTGHPRPLVIRLRSDVPTGVYIDNWQGKKDCLNILEKDPLLSGEIVVTGLGVRNSSNLIIRNLSFEKDMSTASSLPVVELLADMGGLLDNITFTNNTVRFTSGSCSDTSPVFSFTSLPLGSRNAGIHVSKGENIKILKNEIQSCFREAILVRGNRNTEIASNHIYGVFQRGIWLMNSIWSYIENGSLSYYSDNVSIHHNQIESVKGQLGITCLRAGIGGEEFALDDPGTKNYIHFNDIAMDEAYLSSSIGCCDAASLEGPNGILFIDTQTQKFEVKNNILYNNKYGLRKEASVTLDRVIHKYNDFYGSETAEYSGGFTSGIGEITNDPRYRTVGGGMENFNFILQAVPPVSPAIDTGDPDDSFENEPNPNGCRVNMGSYGNTGRATSRPGASHCP